MDKFNENQELAAIKREYEQQLSVERYILDQMDEDEASEFEAYFLSNQDCLDQLELAERLYEGLQQTANASEAQGQPDVSKNRVIAANDSQGSFWQKKIVLPGWAAAAMILVLLMPAFITQLPTSIEKVNNNAAVPDHSLNVVNITFAQRRGQTAGVVQVNSDQQTILATFIDTELNDLMFPHFGFRLSDNTGANSLSYSDLTLASDDMLYINLGSHYLRPGNYQFVISGKHSDGKTEPLLSGEIHVN